jgi:hypothetical protein
MPRVPPIVHATLAGGPAYLLSWEHMPDGAWGAHIAWVELEGEAWKVRSGRVMADGVRQLAGQDYSDVPRRRIG